MIQFVEYASIALDHVPAEIMDLIQFRGVDEYVETTAAVLSQQVQKFQGRTAIEITGQLQVQAVTFAVLKDSEIVGHGTPPYR